MHVFNYGSNGLIIVIFLIAIRDPLQPFFFRRGGGRLADMESSRFFFAFVTHSHQQSPLKLPEVVYSIPNMFNHSCYGHIMHEQC